MAGTTGISAGPSRRTSGEIAMSNSPTPTRALVLLFFAAMLSYSTLASSAVLVPFIPANQLSTVVTVDAHQETSGAWSYEYTIENNSSSLQKAWLFALEVAGDPTDVTSPDGWTFVRNEDSSTVSWAATEVVPLGPGEVDDGSLPLSLHAIPPGTTQSGFGFKSVYPPAQVRYWIQGETPIPVIIGDDDIDVGNADLEHDSYSSLTQGPVVPATCVGAPNGRPCDDGIFCHGSDACFNQECSLHYGDPCPGPDGDGDCSESCDELENDCTGHDLIAFFCDDSNPCSSVSLCDGSGGCAPFNPTAAGTICRSATGACDLAELCTGESADCPADVQAPSGTPCTIGSGNPCAVGQCNGLGDCIEVPGNAGVLCRPSQGGCDIAETCTGTSASCPADAFLSSSAACRSSSGICDLEERCTGSTATCPTNSFASSSTACRPAVGACDVQETCTGTGASCPNNAFLASGTVCRASTAICDSQETCTGSTAACPANAFASSSIVCRAAAGVCDVAEKCTGSSTTCPIDAVAPSTSTCRPSAGVCDISEACTGTSKLCPTDQFAGSAQTCRASVSACDEAETCTGSNSACPADVTVLCLSACPTQPLDSESCDSIQSASLALISPIGEPEKKRLLLRSSGTPRVDVEELGRPQSDNTHYHLCIFNDDALISGTTLTPGGDCLKTNGATTPCWSSNSRQVQYRERARNPAVGLYHVQLKTKRSGVLARIKGAGTHTDVPDLGLLAGSTTVSYQLIRTTGTRFARCWNAWLPYPDRRSDASRFETKSYSNN